MKNNNSLQFSKHVIYIPLAIVFICWFVYWVEIQFSLNFTEFGIFPRKLSGLIGVLCAPFIHSNTLHLFNNSIPLLVLTMSLVYFYKHVFAEILIFGGLLTGILTWVIARDAYHIGASGIVYLLFSFVFFSGIIKRQYQLVAVSLIVIFLYGSMIWYVLPIKEGVSWEGHLAGFVVGLVFAILYRKKGLVKKRHIFKQTEFDLLFDKDGNFNPPNIENEDEMNSYSQTTNS